MFLTIFIGIMEFGMGVYYYNFVSYGAREGARYASTRGSLSGISKTDTESQIVTLIRNQAVGFADASQVSVTTTWPDNTPGNTVTVAVSYRITPLLGFVLGNITVSANSTMPIAQ